MPKVSVIVPVYGVEKYIGECIESILAQTFSDIELILVDDGSLDRSGEICDSYAEIDSRIKVFHKENGGVSSARNYGMQQANGDWLCFVDGDDIIAPTYLADFDLQVEADIYMQGYVKLCSGVAVEHRNFQGFTKKELFEIISYTEENCIINSPCFKLFRRDIIDKYDIKFDANTSYGEDHLFSLEYILHICSAHYTYGEGYMYRMSENESLTKRAVPFKEITYYALEAKKKHDLICEKPGGEYLLPSVGLTFMTNYARTLKYFFQKETSFADFKWIRTRFVVPMRTINTKLLPLKYQLLRVATTGCFSPFIYCMLVLNKKIR